MMPGHGTWRPWWHRVSPSRAARSAGAGAGRPPRPTTMRSMASRRRSRTCCPGSVPARQQVHVAGRWPVGGGLLRAGAGRHRGPRDGLAVAGARCAGERPAGLLRRVGRQPLGGAALRPGRGQLGQLSALPGELSAAACARQRIQRLLPAFLRPSPAGHRQAGWPVRGYCRDAPALARPGPARAHGRLPQHVRGPGLAARPVARAGADDDLRPPRRRAGECRRESPASRRGGHPRLAAALVQPESDFARRHCRRSGTLLRADPLPGRAGGGRDRTRQRHRLRAAPVLRPATFGRAQRPVVLRWHAASGDRDGSSAHAAGDRPSDR